MASFSTSPPPAPGSPLRRESPRLGAPASTWPRARPRCPGTSPWPTPPGCCPGTWTAWWCDLSPQETVAELARHATIPVINGLTDTHHPCQVLSDLMTMEEHFGDLTGLKVAWVGGRQQHGQHLDHRGHAPGFRPAPGLPAGLRARRRVAGPAQAQGARVYLGQDPPAAVADAQVITPTSGPPWARRTRPRPGRKSLNRTR